MGPLTDKDDAVRLYQARLGRELFAAAAYGVGVWVNWAVPLEESPSLRAATLALSYRFGLAQAAVTNTVRRAVADAEGLVGPQRERDFADWRDYVLPTFFERGAKPVRSAIARAIQGSMAELAFVAEYYASMRRGLDYRSPLSWTDSVSRVRIEEAVRECSTAAKRVETGSTALVLVENGTQAPPWGPVQPFARSVESELYRVGLAQSRLTLTLRLALRAAAGLPPLPVPAPPVAVDADGFPIDAEGRAMAIPPPPVPPEVARHPAPWPEALGALEAGARRVQTGLVAALKDPTPRYDVALEVGRQWSTYSETIGSLPLNTLTTDGRAAVLAQAGEVAARARSLVAAVNALGE